MKINKHLLKKKAWKVYDRDYGVILLKAFRTVNGIEFTAEIADGEHKGKWTGVSKSEILGLVKK